MTMQANQGTNGLVMFCFIQDNNTCDVPSEDNFLA